MVRCSTTYNAQTFTAVAAQDLYDQLVGSIQWHDGIRSNSGFTRKAYAVPPNDPMMQIYHGLCEASLDKLECKQDYAIAGVYINYYENGDMYAPNHSHKGTHQLVISLGATRTLTVGKKSFNMSNGSAIIFGGSTHGVPKEPAVVTGRISIAYFLIPI